MPEPDARENGAPRLFIALAIPQPVQSELAKLIENLKKGFQFTASRPSWVQPAMIHLTLRFLGKVESGRIEELSSELRSVAEAFPPMSLSAHGLGVFPSWRRPRVLWTRIRGGRSPLLPLQSGIEEAVVKLGFDPEANPFNPHLTLARFRSMTGAEAARKIVTAHAGFRSTEFIVPEIRLYRSDLRPEGAVHQSLDVFPLAG